jgi:hypothetical protein
VVIEDLSDDFVGFKGVVLCGVGHQYEKDEFFKRLKALGDGLGEAGFIVDRRKIVCVVHQAVLPQEAESVAEGFLDALNYQQLAKGYPFVDVWVIGHYHKGYPVQEVGGKYFINPYSLVRLSRGEHVREHTPQLVDCDFVNNIYKTVGIPHLPYDEVFEEERVEVQSSGFDGDIIENIKKLREDKGLAEGLIEDDDIRSLIEHYLTEADKLLK